MKLENSTQVRILTLPYQYNAHKQYLPKKQTNPFAQRLLCASMLGKCDLCDEQKLLSLRWLLGVLNREDGKHYLLDIGFDIRWQLQNLYRNPNYGDLKNYDVEILRQWDEYSNGDEMLHVVPYPKPTIDFTNLNFPLADTDFLDILCSPKKQRADEIIFNKAYVERSVILSNYYNRT